ncbi:hypothetical protein HGI30_08725 [Paenibacillus albicereus]|uniref:Uncharacterized protein n=1 Tax=Paenibacillus albicereus TaxID=2726185 RepID=A0A6H2GWW5_9BACL|nr:hypothetical protein [Paenibacillus albicereus]QJC51628.1 hypothetical protein HGI30_08725 [Paenibacillus albicereus]
MNLASDDLLNAFRLSGEKVRVIRDEMEQNDVLGIVVAWDDERVMIRKASRRVVQLSRGYTYESAAAPRSASS